MKLTTKGRYAVTAMLDLALHDGAGPVRLAEISRRQEISLSYLEQLFSRLRRAGLVVSTRGPGGGYSLARPAHEISVSEVIEAVDERVDTTRCGGLGNCQNNAPCLTHELWIELSARIREFLEGITLGSLMDNARVRAVADRLESEHRAEPAEAPVSLEALQPDHGT